MIDHMGVQVADVETSLAFYLRAFAPIGMREAIRFPVGESMVIGLAGPEGPPDFWLSPAAVPETRELHIAFRAPGPAEVDAVHEPAVAAGAGGGRPPRARPGDRPADDARAAADPRCAHPQTRE